MSCITNVSYKIIINGKVTDSFALGCGLKQGNPLSPYIFVLCMEKLSHMILKRLKEKKWKPIKVSRGRPSISHLSFADNLILFGKTSNTQVESMKECMGEFCIIFGQQKIVHNVNWDVVSLDKSKGGHGVKHMKDYNQALLAKASWRLLKDEDSLWCRMMRGKYLKAGRLLSVALQDRASSSCVLKGIAHGAQCVTKELLWRVGNGNEINFWTDSWLPNIGVLQPYALGNLNQSQLNRKVSFFLSEGDWKFNLLCECLPLEIVNHILSIHAGGDSSGRDTLLWGHSKNGYFSVKSAYSLIHDNVNVVLWKWKLIWKIKAPPKILIFLWIMLHGKTMTNVHRNFRGLTNIADCPRCGAVYEDLEHLLRGCPRSINIWENCCKDSTKFLEFKGDWETWMHKNLTLNSRILGLGPSNVVVAWVIWYIWKWRCAKVFEASLITTPHEPKNIIFRAITEWMSYGDSK
ncbi:hypothetical protein ACOSQ4_026113 [Xanthoceras sorbifolium]